VNAGSVSVANNGGDVNLGPVTTSGVQTYANPSGTTTVTGNLIAADSSITFTDSVAVNDGVTIMAQENVKKRLAVETTNGLTGEKTPPAPIAALPTDTYTNFSKIRLPGRVADLKHIPNAHTDGDTYVWFKTANVLATGDTFTNGRYPNIDFANGGNIKGMIAAADAYLKLTNAKSRIVPGHGPVADKAALTEYRAMLVTARDRMDKLVKDGKSEDDVVAAKPFADLDKKWALSELASTNFIRVVWHSLADKPEAPKKGFLKRILRRS